MKSIRLLSTLLVAIALASCSAPPQSEAGVTVSIVGLNDVHGELNASEHHGGLVGHHEARTRTQDVPETR